MRLSELMDNERNTIRQAINSFDENGSGYVPTEQLGNLMRYLYLIPTNEEVKQLGKILDPDGTGRIKGTILPNAIAQFWPNSPNELEYRIWRAFMIFDKLETGTIPTDEFRLILTSIGTEPLPEQEVRKIIKRFENPNTHKVEYAAIVREWLK
ncbi:unnamed protein product [Calicophoron daubneyi]|uniref:EF-hand domain-containing protein n=1 Tax=Calicophoron daubneyi TaxID=300641 RepID=A0AAV2TR11_CALDB